MLVNYFKFKNISSRGKVMALSVIGGVFIFVSFLAIWQRNFSDSLINYLPTDTNLYIHFSRPKINSSEKIDQILTKVFTEMGVNYSELDIDREVAVIGHFNNDQNEYGLIFKTDRPTKVKKLLTSSNIEYKILAYNRFLIAPTSWLNTYQSDKQNIVKTSIMKRFHTLSSINIYASLDFLNHNSDLNLGIIKLLSQNENSDLIISLKAKGDELKMFYGGISSVVSHYSDFKSQSFKENVMGDIVFSTSDFFKLLSNWQHNLQIISDDDYQLFSSSKLAANLSTYLPSDTRSIFLSATKNDKNANWFFLDYDFYLVVENVYTDKVEELLKTIMASRYPTTKYVYLSDGTRVLELLPDIDRFSFLDKNGYRYLYSPDEQFALIYKIAGQRTIITNNESLLSQNWPNLDENINYLKVTTDLLPDNSFTDYLRVFKSLEVNKNGLYFR